MKDSKKIKKVFNEYKNQQLKERKTKKSTKKIRNDLEKKIFTNFEGFLL